MTSTAFVIGLILVLALGLAPTNQPRKAAVTGCLPPPDSQTRYSAAAGERASNGVAIGPRERRRELWRARHVDNADRLERRARRARWSIAAMAKVISKCPLTGHYVYIGVDVDAERFANLPETFARAFCPFCACEHS